jgi:hypothetical protein
VVFIRFIRAVRGPQLEQSSTLSRRAQSESTSDCIYLEQSSMRILRLTRRLTEQTVFLSVAK